ncbi:AAA family ATPase [Aureispira anguillae]|uniref:AAA family ATPase n=1 Tax=Aureispira anguillae TaxID=2864201 RepID=A0A915YGG9_9BACT|nr:AAA family ATPase [Aureispira anguillae]BDS12653.1 AAA family ATPase [Aureispira anguillae]
MQKIKLPFHIVQLQIENNPDIITTPILDNQVLWVNIPAPMMAGKFGDSYQDKLLDKGEYYTLLDYYVQGDFEQKKVSVQFKAGKSQIAFKELEVSFDYFLQTHQQGYWAVVPALGVEAFTLEEDEIEAAVQEAIRLDFMRNKRLNLLQDVISTLWFDKATLSTQTLDLRTYTPSEIASLQEAKKKELLPKVAQQVSIHQQTLFGYQKELHQLADTLKGKYNKNVLIVGRSGVGKSTLVWELVHRRSFYKISKNIWETTASTLIKELSGEVGWQENLTLLCKELIQRGDILFIRNLLELFEVGQYQGNNVSVADYLREYIARGEITIISECTEEEFARIETRSPNYINNFQVIQLAEPQDNLELEQIILEKVQSIAHTEKIVIEKEAIKETIRLNKRYTPYSGFPGKPIRFLESILIGSKAKQHNMLKENQLYVLNRTEVIKTFCEETGMPPFIVDPAIPMDLPKIEQFFNANVFGQSHAIQTLTNILASVKTALLRQGKPIASMLFVGPTGVGKTEMAKVLAQFMFGSRDKMIRFDMSEYSTPYAVARLTGESYFSDGLLTSAVRRDPFCVLLFDELEKAHPSFNDLLLQMLGEGRLTDSQGKVVNFCSSIIIMTSNIGAKKLQNNGIGWVEDKTEQREAEHFLNEVRHYFRPEIFNRIDQVVPFYSLTKEVVRFVVERELDILKKREGILHRNLEFKLSDTLYDVLCTKGYQPKYGARALQRTLREELIIPLAHQLNQYSFDEKLVLEVDIQDGAIHIDIEADPLKLELMLEELTQNEYMDFASELRQNMVQLFEGRFYVRLLSELDILKRSKRKNAKKFWANEKKSLQFTNFLALQDKFEQHRKTGEQNELEMALITMGLTTLNTNLYKAMEQWEKDYFELKLELYRTLKTDKEGLYLGIYGKEPKRLLDYYTKICAQKGFKWSARSVWYQEEVYNAMVDVENDQGEVILQEKARQYHKKILNLEDPNCWKPEKKEDVLLGIELLIDGIGANLYLNEEEGWHRIIIADQKYMYWVQSSAQDLKTPDAIHRKSFFQKYKKARRTYSPTHLEDTIFKSPKRELRPAEQLPHLIKILDQLFIRKLDALLF